ncbi:MAG: NUDIX hydrolase [Micromonosporaceae bacterium]
MAKRSEAESHGERLHKIAMEIAALAQNGLNYGTDRYEIARYRRLQEISAEVMGMISGVDDTHFHHQIAAEVGHATPKVDVRGALFDADERVLLVREKVDGRWTLPGGWADALDTPTEAITREVAEEAGLKVRVLRLAAIYDGFRSNGHPTAPFHIYKLLFLLGRLDDAEPVAGLDGETTGVGFFALDSLPELSTRRTTESQLGRLLAHHRDPTMPADVD